MIALLRLSLLLLLLLATGCVASLASWPGKIKSSGYDGMSATYPSAGEQIAQYAALHLASVYPPGQTTLALDTKSAFGQILERNLRQRGFGVADHGIPLQYQLDVVQGERDLGYLSLRLPEGSITQSYVLHGGKLVPGSLAMTGMPQYVAPTERTLEVPAPPAVQSVPLASSPPVGYVLDAYTDDSGDVHCTVKKGGRPQAGVKVHFETSPAFPNLRAVDRTTDANGQILLRKLIVADSAVPLRGKVAGQSIQCVLDRPSEPAPASMPAVAARSPALSPALTSLSLPPPAPAVIPYIPIPQAQASPPAPDPVTRPVAQTQTTPTIPSPIIASSAAPASGVIPYLPAAQALVDKPMWVLHSGMLRSQMQQWGATAGYQIIWSAPNDFDLETGAEFKGDFVTVIRQLFAHLHDQGMPLRVTVYQPNRVVTVSED